MNIICLILFLLISLPLHAVIFGLDDRKDINSVPHLRPLAQAVAVAVPNMFINKLSSGNNEITDVEPLGGSSTVYACMDERFAKQPIVGNCTGFLVKDRYLVTAGHCALPTGIINNDDSHPYCRDFSWYFDFNLDGTGKVDTSNIPSQKIYGCKRIVRAENISLPGKIGLNSGNDFAVIELDRPVSFKPLPISKSKVKKGDAVFAIGHPSGLPAKYSGTSSVLKTSNKYHFEVNLDSQSGNSGSPVFNSKNEVVGILVSGHPIDYYQSPSGCFRANTCDIRGKNCKKNSEFSYLPTSNSILYIKAVLPYLPRLYK